MSAARYKEILLEQLADSGLANKADFEALMADAFISYTNRNLTRVTADQLAQRIGLAGRVSVAHQLLVGLGERAKMDALAPDTPMSHTYWTVEAEALKSLIAEANEEQRTNGHAPRKTGR